MYRSWNTKWKIYLTKNFSINLSLHVCTVSILKMYKIYLPRYYIYYTTPTISRYVFAFWAAKRWNITEGCYDSPMVINLCQNDRWNESFKMIYNYWSKIDNESRKDDVKQFFFIIYAFIPFDLRKSVFQKKM